jgi:pyridoxamine 5'-phosphate oxidase
MSLWEPSDLSGFRVSYDRGELLERDLATTPLAQFNSWWEEVTAAGVVEPNAMVLGTSGADGRLSARTVLLKGVDVQGFRFFTNYTSRKAQAIAEHPEVSLVFPWFAIHRQVTVLGVAEKMSAAENAAYFRTRPRGSQIAAWASFQSSALADRESLDQRMAELESRWPDGTEIPTPDFWGGYLVRARSVEFWHGRVSRLHDRLRFESDLDEGADLEDDQLWRITRYSP